MPAASSAGSNGGGNIAEQCFLLGAGVANSQATAWEFKKMEEASARAGFPWSTEGSNSDYFHAQADGYLKAAQKLGCFGEPKGPQQ